MSSKQIYVVDVVLKRTARNRSKVHVARRLFFLIRPIKLLIWGHRVIVLSLMLLISLTSRQHQSHEIIWLVEWGKNDADCIVISFTQNAKRQREISKSIVNAELCQIWRHHAPTKDMILTVLRFFPKNGRVISIKLVFRWIDTLFVRSHPCIALISLKIISTYMLPMTERSKVRHSGTGLWLVQSLPEEQSKKNWLYQ